MASTADAALTLADANPDIPAGMTDICMPARSITDLLADITTERTDPVALGGEGLISGHGLLNQARRRRAMARPEAGGSAAG